MFNPSKTRPKRRNRRNPAKNTSNPRARKNPKSRSFTHGFGREITGQRTTKGSHKFPPSNPQETGAPRRLDRYPPVRPVWHCCSTVFGSSVLALWINQGTQWFFGEPLETPGTRCSLRQSPLMTRLPRSPSSTLVLRLNQKTIHDFILLFMPPCGPHLTPLATGSLERSLLDFSTAGGLTSDDHSHLFFTCTKTSHVATCTCNT
jgi:hypothetical protein